MKPLAILAALTLPLTAGGAAPPMVEALLIRGAHVFDGSGSAAQPGDVLIEGERIVRVAPRIAAPPGATVIEGAGHTLLPGLHDLHTHMRSPGFGGPDDPGKAYAAYLAAGVTTASDFSVYHEMLAPIRAMTASGAVPAPHLKLAIRLSTPGGHGAEYGWGKDFTLEVNTPRAARLAMGKALAYRPDVIKVFTDGWRYGRSPDLTSMDVPTLAAIVDAAHAAGVPVVTHTVTLAGAKLAARAGVDALGHGIGDAPVDDEVVALMRARGTAYVPTLAVYEPLQTRRFTPRAAAALRAPEAAAEARRDTETAIPELETRRWAIMRANVKALADAGIAIGVGTDAGIGGVYHGSATLHEIRLLTEAGLTPARALAAATSASAAILNDTPRHGRIAPGQRADLLLVAGRPDRRIDDLFAVREVVLAGRRVNRARLAELLGSTAMSPLPRTAMPGPIYSGNGPEGRTDLGTLIVDNSDAGVDHSELEHVRLPDPRRLFALARFGAAPRPYARLSLPLTPGGVQLADASGFAGVMLTVRGAGAYRLMFDQYGLRQSQWFAAGFDAGARRTRIRLPFERFASRDAAARFDAASLRKIEIELSGAPGGKQWIEIDNLRFYR
ncbi:amidohydrolase family protein [Sphingomonas baiyangensis]|uniref:Amidohydrolase n=1 Tax=Sphingomonas baiyangensis TaxID=2572576 RepID=A0A4U1L2J0_9SPHN|nr:amidohydrolase family protein [Sphingomonas baiyangensis]TKD51069.1 amidohydrolase [Sphingomonas baiyangensis]